MSTAPPPASSHFATGRILTPRIPARPSTSEQQAVARLLATTRVGSTRRSGALETVWGAFMATLDGHISPGLQVSQGEPVRVAVVSPGGTSIVGVSGPSSYSWSAIVYDAPTGQPLAALAGPGTWPHWYTTLSAAP